MTDSDSLALLEALAADLQELPLTVLPEEFQKEFWPAYQELIAKHSK